MPRRNSAASLRLPCRGNQGYRVAALAPEADASSWPLAPALAAAFAEKRGKALLVFRDGELALEHYADGLGPETRFNSFSMAKSLVGALVYKALAEGRLTSLDQTLG